MLTTKHAPNMAPILTQSQSFTSTQLFSFTRPSKSAQQSTCVQSFSISVVNSQLPQTSIVDNTFIVRQRWSRREKEKPFSDFGIQQKEIWHYGIICYVSSKRSEMVLQIINN